MAASMNKVILIGRLGRDPEMKLTPGGEPVCNFSLATSRVWNNASGERQEVTEWHNIVTWRKLAEQCNEYLAKGRLVMIEGRLETRSWDDRDTGKKMYRTEIVADTMVMLDPKPDAVAGDGDVEAAERPSFSRQGSSGASVQGGSGFSRPPGSGSRADNRQPANVSSFSRQGHSASVSTRRPMVDVGPDRPFEMDDDTVPF
ncbi:MAG: single-stranded DNA-binding protein [Actinobacteria bacterium]|nr:single-stranded DNA-binding protein [Actinomycetota bacterium]